MNRFGIHRLPRSRVIRHLRAMGFHIEVLPPTGAYDFRLDGQLRVALRVGRLTAHWSRLRVRERQYIYRYPVWCFNFHRHGRMQRYCDVFICVPLVAAQPPDLRGAYIIPWAACTGSTFSLPPTRYTGGYARYRGAWEQLRTASVGGITSLTQDSSAVSPQSAKNGS